MEINIVKSKPEDIEHVVYYIKAMLSEMSEMGGLSINTSENDWKEIQKGIEQKLTSSEHLYLFAKSRNDTIGFAECKIAFDGSVFEPRKLLHISSFYTDPSFRKQGVATNLYQSMISWAKEKECKEIELNALINNPAVGLYKKLGFAEFEINFRRPML